MATIGTSSKTERKCVTKPSRSNHGAPCPMTTTPLGRLEPQDGAHPKSRERKFPDTHCALGRPLSPPADSERTPLARQSSCSTWSPQSDHHRTQVRESRGRLVLVC